MPEPRHGELGLVKLDVAHPLRLDAIKRRWRGTGHRRVGRRRRRRRERRWRRRMIGARRQQRRVQAGEAGADARVGGLGRGRLPGGVSHHRHRELEVWVLPGDTAARAGEGLLDTIHLHLVRQVRRRQAHAAARLRDRGLRLGRLFFGHLFRSGRRCNALAVSTAELLHLGRRRGAAPRLRVLLEARMPHPHAEELGRRPVPGRRCGALACHEAHAVGRLGARDDLLARRRLDLQLADVALPRRVVDVVEVLGASRRRTDGHPHRDHFSVLVDEARGVDDNVTAGFGTTGTAKWRTTRGPRRRRRPRAL